MKVGTPGFQGDRLKQARIAMGLTQASMAMLLGERTRQAISAFEAGDLTPSPETFHRILAVTRQPAHFFLSKVPPGLDDTVTHFRSLRSLEEVAKASAEQYVIWLAEYIRYVKEYVEIPFLNLPDFSDVPRDPLDITNNHIRKIAKKLRSHWNLGDAPLPDVTNLLEANGFVISVQCFNSAKWDAVSFWDEMADTPIILLNGDNLSYFRMRFTILHELFHLLFHKWISQELKDQKDYVKKLEDQANYFVGEIALPHDTFASDIYALKLDALRVIKLKWRISIAAMIQRIYQLRLIDENELKSLWVNYSRRKWRKEEPWDDDLENFPLEEAVVLKQAVEAMVEYGAQTVEEIRVNGVFSTETQSTLTGLSENFWQRSVPNLKIHKMFG